LLTNTQGGVAGEQLFAACVTLSSVGELELFKPLTDDDHTDVSAGRRGKVPALAIQVKTALKLDRKGLAVARMAFPSGVPREHPAFIYAIVYVIEACVETAWLVPSADFNRHTYRGPGRHGKGIELEFMASPVRADRWAPYRCGRLQLGPLLIALIDSLPKTPPPNVPGAHILLRRRGSGPG
jgi:hypothetical protein